MKSWRCCLSVVAASVLLAGCAWEGSKALVDSDETFRQRVLECPAQSSKRMPTCDVALDRLRAYGDQACAWLGARPTAIAYQREDYWNDPFHIDNIAWDFANATRDSTTVPPALERSERKIVATMAWRHLCPEFSNRYNDPPPVD